MYSIPELISNHFGSKFSNYMIVLYDYWFLGAAVSSATRVTSSVSGRYLTLLVIDDQNTDWSKYFRGRRIGEYEIRVEQAEFREITVTSTADAANVSMAVMRGGTRVGRSFRPDFLLVSYHCSINNNIHFTF